MRILIFLAIICLAVALVCSLVPTAVAGAGWSAWVTGGLLFWAIDVAVGGWVAPVGRRVQ